MTKEQQAKFEALKSVLAKAKFDGMDYVGAVSLINAIQFVQLLENEAKQEDTHATLPPAAPAKVKK